MTSSCFHCLYAPFLCLWLTWSIFPIPAGPPTILPSFLFLGMDLFCLGAVILRQLLYFLTLFPSEPYPAGPAVQVLFDLRILHRYPAENLCSLDPLWLGSGNCHMSPPGTFWMVYALLCCPCSRYRSEKGPKCGHALHSVNLPSACREHLPLALPDQ